jgi:hypothetical protein
MRLADAMAGALAVALLCGCAARPAADKPIVDNRRLVELFDQDQAARDPQQKSTDWEKVNAQDAERRTEVLALLNAGAVRTARDYYCAAMVFQHGESADDIRLAFSFAWIAASMRPEAKELRWLAAAAWDRILMREKLPQWYGTQFVRPDPDGAWQLYEVDESAVTDEQRAAMGVPPLAEARKKAKEIPY